MKDQQIQENVRTLREVLSDLDKIKTELGILLSNNMGLKNPEEWQWKPTKISDIAVTFCKNYNVGLCEIRGNSRKRIHTVPRFMCMALIRSSLSNTPLSAIGSYFGYRDHSTVIKAISEHENLMQTDEYYAYRFNNAKSLTVQKKAFS